MNEKLFNDKLLKLINSMINEQEGYAGPVEKGKELVPAQQPPLAQPVNAKAQTQQQANPPALGTKPTDIIPGEEQKPEEMPKDIRFIDTRKLFYTPPPPDSDSWPDDTQKVPQYKSLQNKVAPFLSKKLGKNFKLDDAGAARYNPQQFRVTLRGVLTGKAKFLVDTRKEKADLYYISVPDIYGKEIELTQKNLQTSLKPFDIEELPTFSVDLTSHGAQIRKTTYNVIKNMDLGMNQDEVDDEIMPKVIDGVARLFKTGELEKGIKEIPTDNLTDVITKVVKELGIEGAGKKEVKTEKGKKETGTTKIDKLIDDFATGETLDLKKVDAKSFSEYAKKKYGDKIDPKNEAESIKLLYKAYEEWKKQKNESFDLEKYLKKLLVEVKENKSVASVTAKEVLSSVITSINESINELIENGALVAPRGGDIKSTLIQLGTCNKLYFDAKEVHQLREEDGKTYSTPIKEFDRSKVKKLLIDGEIKMQMNLLFDARIVSALKGVMASHGGTWEFRMFHKPNEVVRATF
jgi:hypothetical protein